MPETVTKTLDVGQPVKYTVATDHATLYMRPLAPGADPTFDYTLAGLITRLNADGTADLVAFPMNKPPVHIEGATEGAGPGQFLAAGS